MLQIYIVLGTMGLAMITYTILTVYMFTHQQRSRKRESYANVGDEDSAAREMHVMIRSEQVRAGASCERNDSNLSYNSSSHYARSKSVDFDVDAKRK